MSGGAAVRTDPGRVWSWLLLLFGGGVSIAVNLGHAFLRPAGAGADWAPGRWAIAWGVVVPMLLFFAVKGITVIAWPRGVRWVLWRFCGALPVCGLAGYVSWDHISGLLASIGESHAVCLLAPLAVDGLMFIGVGGLMIPTPRPQSAPMPVGSRPGSDRQEYRRPAQAGPEASWEEQAREFLAGRQAVPGEVAERVARTVPAVNGGRSR